jgi:titin
MSSGGIDLSGYRIFRSLDPVKEGFDSGRDVPNVTEWIDHNVELGTIYHYRILAFNPSYEGAVSDEFWIKATDRPSPPENLTASPHDWMIRLEWDEISKSGGSPLIGYRVYRQFADTEMVLISIVLPMQTEYEDTHVVNGVEYTYGVTSFTPVNESLMSNLVTLNPIGPPVPPSRLEAVGSDGIVNLTWEHPAFGISVTDLRFDVYAGRTEEALTFATTISDRTQWTHSDLVNGEEWYYKVIAVSEYGDSPPSEVVRGRPSTFPGRVKDLRLDPSDAQVSVSWDPPSDDGGMPVLEYRIFKGIVSTPLKLLASVDATETSYVDDQVINGHRYRYAVMAVSVVGEGGLSDPVDVTPAGVPKAPSSFEVILGEGNVILSWNPPVDDGGDIVKSYSVRRGLSDEAMVLLTVVSNGTLFIDPDVVGGKVYYYDVAATNDIGVGTTAPIQDIEVMLRPGGPTNLKVVVKDGDVVITWSPPESDGGVELTGYRLLRGHKEGSLSVIQDLDLVTTFTDDTVEDGRTYWYSVRAVNVVGEGEKAPSEKAEMPAAGVPMWLMALIIVLVILAMVVIAMLLRSPPVVEKAEGGPEVDESEEDEETVVEEDEDLDDLIADLEHDLDEVDDEEEGEEEGSVDSSR